MLLIGCGYVGVRLARQYLDRGEPVLGVVSSSAGAERLAALGIPGVICDLDAEAPTRLPLQGADLFHLAPPPPSGTEDTRTRRLIDAFAEVGHPRRLVYIGTTGVYGDCAGAWVDEQWPTRPQADRSLRRLDAERALSLWSEHSGGELVVLRVAGIYGPERLPLERIRAGVPMVRPQEAPYTNRIHVDDLVSACVAAMERGESGAVYNVCDGNPSSMTDYFLEVARAAGLPPPPLIPRSEAEGQLSRGMLSYLGESRRLSNRRLREELGVPLRYPTLAAGLASILDDRSDGRAAGQTDGLTPTAASPGASPSEPAG